MSLGFNATHGVANTDRLSLASASFGTGAMSIAVFYRGGTITNDYPRICNHAGENVAIYYTEVDAAPNGRWVFTRNFNGGTALVAYWDLVGTFPTTGSHSFVVTHTGDTAYTSVKGYFDGSEVAPTNGTNGSGTIDASASACVVGNRASDTARVWAGYLERFTAWTVALSAGEAASFHAGTATSDIQGASRIWAAPMIDDDTESILGGATLTGTLDGAILAPSGVGTGGPFPARYFAEEYWARRYFPGSYNDGAATSSEWIPKIWIM